MTDEEGFDNTGAPTTPATHHSSSLAPKRQRGATKPAGEKRQRRTSSQAKLALALVETHLAGVYSQMRLLEQAITDLRASLS